MLWKNGKLRIDGRAVHDMYVWRGKTPAQSKNEWDVLELAATIPGDKAFLPLERSKCPLVKN
jgi:branched-chain amino acid transport system substrate-binding protein